MVRRAPDGSIQCGVPPRPVARRISRGAAAPKVCSSTMIATGAPSDASPAAGHRLGGTGVGRRLRGPGPRPHSSEPGLRLRRPGRPAFHCAQPGRESRVGKARRPGRGQRLTAHASAGLPDPRGAGVLGDPRRHRRPGSARLPRVLRRPARGQRAARPRDRERTRPVPLGTGRGCRPVRDPPGGRGGGRMGHRVEGLARDGARDERRPGGAPRHEGRAVSPCRRSPPPESSPCSRSRWRASRAWCCSRCSSCTCAGLGRGSIGAPRSPRAACWPSVPLRPRSRSASSPSSGRWPRCTRWRSAGSAWYPRAGCSSGTCCGRWAWSRSTRPRCCSGSRRGFRSTARPWRPGPTRARSPGPSSGAIRTTRASA
jgi:hypothetical protein